MPWGRQGRSKWEPKGLQMGRAGIAGEMECLRVTGQWGSAAVKKHGIKAHEGKIKYFLLFPVQEANC